MSQFKHGFSLLIVWMAVLGAAACAPGAASIPDVNTVQAPENVAINPTSIIISGTTLPKDDAGNEIVARVNDDAITLTAYQRMIARYQQQPIADPGGIPKMVLDTMVQQLLIDQAATSNQIEVTPEEVEQELQGLIQSAGGDSQWQQWLQDNLYTEDELRHSLRSTLLTNRMRDHLTSDLDASVAQVHARHILVSTQEQASQLLARLRDGEDFGSLAATYSLDTSTNTSGGDLGWFTQEELLEPALAKVAFELEPGQIAGPVQTSLGWHVIQTLERGVRPINAGTRAELARARFESWLQMLTLGAQIETYL